MHAVELREEGVKRGRFARSCRPGDEHDAVGLRQQQLDGLAMRLVEAKAVEREAFLAEKAQAHRLALDTRDTGHAHVDGLPLGLQMNASVLRQALLGDVEFAHHLDAGNHRGLELLDVLRHGNLVQEAVDAVADAQAVRLWLDVNVRGLLRQRLADDLIHKLHHRGVLVLVVDHIGLVTQMQLIRATATGGNECIESLRAHAVELLHRVEQLTTWREAPAHRKLRLPRHGLPRHQITRIMTGQHEAVARCAGLVALKTDGEHLMPHREPRRDHALELRHVIRLGLRCLQPFPAKIFGQMPRENALIHCTAFD